MSKSKVATRKLKFYLLEVRRKYATWPGEISKEVEDSLRSECQWAIDEMNNRLKMESLNVGNSKKISFDKFIKLGVTG